MCISVLTVLSLKTMYVISEEGGEDNKNIVTEPLLVMYFNNSKSYFCDLVTVLYTCTVLMYYALLSHVNFVTMYSTLCTMTFTCIIQTFH